MLNFKDLKKMPEREPRRADTLDGKALIGCIEVPIRRLPSIISKSCRCYTRPSHIYNGRCICRLFSGSIDRTGIQMHFVGMAPLLGARAEYMMLTSSFGFRLVSTHLM